MSTIRNNGPNQGFLTFRQVAPLHKVSLEKKSQQWASTSTWNFKTSKIFIKAPFRKKRNEITFFWVFLTIKTFFLEIRESPEIFYNRYRILKNKWAKVEKDTILKPFLRDWAKNNQGWYLQPRILTNLALKLWCKLKKGRGLS